MERVTYELSNDDLETIKGNKNGNDINYRLKAGIFFTSVTAASALVAFGMTLASVKRRDPVMFEKGCTITREIHESGVALAVRALKWATIYSVSGCSLISFGIWKLSGASNMEEFRLKVGSILPRIKKNDPPEGRTEFSGLNDLLRYVSEDYEKDIKSIKASKLS